MISGYSNATFSVMKTYENNRNLITGIENKSGTNLISQFAYSNDAIGRRTARIDNSPVLNSPVTNNFSYNTKSELINAIMSTNSFTYNYGQIGNRLKYIQSAQSASSADTNDYLSNELNQYTNITCR